MKKIYKAIVSILLVTIMMVSLCIEILAAKVEASNYKQNDTNLCWAATTTSIHNFLFPNNQKSQTQVVIDVYGIYSNRTATLATVCTKFFIPKYGYASAIDNLGAPTYEKLDTEFSGQRPVFASTTILKPDSTRPGHAITLCTTFTMSGTKHLQYMDPYTGTKIEQLYTKMTSENLNIPKITGTITGITKL